MNRLTPENPPRDKRTVEEFKQFLEWAGSPSYPGVYIHLARGWYQGLLTIEEGQRIEAERQVWQFVGVQHE